MRILSGIQPSGALHLGNYFGMMQPAIALQEKGEAFYFIADYHSMTSLFDANERRKNTLDVALDFLACGLDPKKSVFFASRTCRKFANWRGFPRSRPCPC
jgi:tryptophanyl-tRNA synthetase